jgi:hypothetical protein
MRKLRVAGIVAQQQQNAASLHPTGDGLRFLARDVLRIRVPGRQVGVHDDEALDSGQVLRRKAFGQSLPYRAQPVEQRGEP